MDTQKSEAVESPFKQADCSVKWEKRLQGGWVLVFDEGKFSGALKVRILLCQGGNSKWSVFLIVERRKRPKKLGRGWLYNHVSGEHPPQFETKDQAKEWSEAAFKKAISENSAIKRPEDA